MRRSTARRTAAATTAAALLAVLGLVSPASGAGVITVTTTSQAGIGGCSLGEAIIVANLDSNADYPECSAGSGDDTIVLPANAVLSMSAIVDDRVNFMGPTATPMVFSTITIEGSGARLQHVANGINFRAFAVNGGGNLTIHDLEINGFTAKGGNGRVGGGGGLGAGGAIYVQSGSLTLERTTFVGNGAVGGNGSNGSTVVGGGGGGLGGNGGGAFSAAFVGGGGGGGARGDGGVGDVYIFGGGPGGGGGGTVADGESGDQNPDTGHTNFGGYDCGANGGSDDNGLSGEDGDDADDGCWGGGGGGGESYAEIVGVLGAGDGGSGSYGGGGGGTGYSLGSGGDGGFGGGGGGGTTDSSALDGIGPSGGDGGFGAGGGSGYGGYISGGPGEGGTFGGSGTTTRGGAGAGLGGAVFGHEASITVINSTFTANYVSHGLPAGDTSAERGQDAGGALFLVAGSLTVINATIAGNEATGAGGGIAVYRPQNNHATTLTLWNTILANNGAKECFLKRHDDAGNVATVASGNLITANGLLDAAHNVSPCPAPDLTDDPQLQGLALNAPGITRTMALGSLSPAIDAADNSFAPGQDQRGVGRPQGPSADIGAFEFSGAAPVTTIDLSPASPDGSNDWYVSSVGLTISATDADSTVAQTRCVLDPASVPASFADLPDAACGLTSVTADGEHTVYAGSVDTEANVEIPVVSASFKIDQTDPTLDPALSDTTIELGQTGVTASPNATDTTSGIASSSCDPVDTSTAGVHTVGCTATDAAGNTATASIDYVVAYRILGFFSPVPGSKWQAGSTVPIKIALGDADGVRIGDAEAQALADACQVTFSVSGAQTKRAQCLKYDPLTDQFIYPWKLGKRPLGEATITVTISYAGTTSTTSLSEAITIVRLPTT